MVGQPNRLGPSERGFAAAAIDRARPITFLLDGQPIAGFAGDTVLSAALASGVIEAGTFFGDAIGLSPEFAPPIIARAQLHRPDSALPMDRTPALDGADLVTQGSRRWRPHAASWRGRLQRLLYGPPRTLGHHLEHREGRDGPWLDLPPSAELSADIVIVGGGVAGLSAAVAAGEAGEQVVLVERRPDIGGDAAYFGTTEGEKGPQILLSELRNQLGRLPNVQILTLTEALSIHPGEVRAHHVISAEGQCRGQVVSLKAARILLAPGSAEVRPVFPGNRAPGVSGAVSAFHLGQDYSVWVGRSAVFFTVSSTAYRTAILAHDSGVSVTRIADARPAPRSRFIDFSKASGLPLGFGLVPESVQPAPHGLLGMHIQLAITLEGQTAPEPVWTEQFVVSGGWQPRLALWLDAGGRVEWSAQSRRITHLGDSEGVALAGAAAGFGGTSACARSGIAAVAALFGRDRPKVADPLIDPVFESPDGVVETMPPPPFQTSGAYLDTGDSLASLRPTRRRDRALGLLGLGRRSFDLADSSRPLSLGDLSSAVRLGELDAEQLGAVAGARITNATRIAPLAAPPTHLAPLDQTGLPSFLDGRFGAKPDRWVIQPPEPRRFEPGCLIYADSETTDPRKAMGVILGPAPGDSSRHLGIMRADGGGAARSVVVRDAGGAVTAQALRSERA